MPRKSPMEIYTAEFEKVESDRLERTRSIKDTIRSDTRLKPLASMVLGITGSKKALEEAEFLAEAVEAHQGEPLLVIGAYDDMGPYPVAGRIRAGIISGPLEVTGDYDEGDREGYYGSLAVPASIAISYFPTIDRTYNDGVRQHYAGSIQVKHYIDRRWDNRTTDPTKDVAVNEPTAVLIGREAVWTSGQMSGDIGRMLLELDRLQAEANVTV